MDSEEGLNNMGKKVEKNEKIKQWIFPVVLFLTSVIIRGLSSDYMKEIVVFMDEINYVSIGRSLLHDQSYLVQNAVSDFQKALYSIIIMPAFFFESTGMQIKVIAWINSFVMSLAVFPAFGLARRILKDRKWIYLILVFSVTVPNFLFTMSFMSEVSFFTLSLCVIYFVWRIIETEDLRSRIILNIFLGIFCYLVYLNKEIALYYIVAYVIMRIVFILFHRTRVKGELCCLVTVCGVFVVCYLCANAVFFQGMENQYVQAGLRVTLSGKRVAYLIYAFLYHLIFAVLAFGVFSVVIPIAELDGENRNMTQFSIFLLFSLIIGCSVIAYMISLQEDWATRSPRLHLRYLEPLMIPFLISSVYYLNKLTEGRKRKVNFRTGILLGIYSIAFVGIAYDVVRRCHVDNTSIYYFEKLLEKVKTLDIPKFTEEWKMLLLREFIVVIILICFLVLCRNARRYVKMFVIGFICLNLINTEIGYKAWRWIYENYKNTGENAELIVELNSELKQMNLNGNILLIAEGRRINDATRLIDTYVDESIYITDEMMLDENGFLEKGMVDFSTDFIQYWDMFTARYYTDLKQVDYILGREGIPVKEDSIELVQELPAGYKLYKNLDPNYIYLEKPVVQE